MAKPYVLIAEEYGYAVEIVEPDTAWSKDPVELEKRNVRKASIGNTKQFKLHFILQERIMSSGN